jgi:hypothetical protein
MTGPRPPSPLDRAFFALVTRGWNADKIASYESTLRKRDKEAANHVQDVIHRELIIRTELYSLCIRAAILFTMVVFAVLPLVYFWTSEKAA